MDILIDLDGTLVNLVDKWLYYFNNRYPDYPKYSREDVTDYSFGGRFEREEWRDFLRIPGFHADLPWEDMDAPIWLRKLKDKGHHLMIATHSAAWESPRDKYSWVHTHLRIPGLIESMGNDVFLNGKKQRIRADILVDDAVHNLIGFPGATICYDQPWNKEWQGRRAFDWEGVFLQVQDIVYEKEQERKEMEDMKVVSSYYSGGCY